MAEFSDLLFELGTEELPPKSLLSLSQALQAGMEAGLRKAGLSYRSFTSYASPRRLAFLIEDLITAQPDQTVERRGPAKAQAYNPDGTLTKAAEGFGRSCGATPDQLTVIKTDKGEWLGFIQTVTGAPTRSLLAGLINQALAGLPIAKRMRWGAGDVEFVRPAHWAVLIFEGQVIADEVLGLVPGQVTRGLRTRATVGQDGIKLPLDRLADYTEILREQGGVIASFDERRQRVRALAEAAAREVGGVAHIEPELLDEVTALVEWPVPVLGNFETRFLDLPMEVLITTMQENQKYFPVKSESGGLLPHFITFANVTSSRPETVREGNERVVRPRLSDAEFFWKQDRKQTLEDRVPALASVTFQKTLGSVLDKSSRVRDLASAIAKRLGEDDSRVARAALLAKADLLTEMVGEFTNLQGTMGRYYALAEGAPDDVAWAIEEQYLPKVSGGALPKTRTGEILALAEKLDTLTGIFSAGLIPTGDKDPYALRRAALGILRLLIEGRLDLNVDEWVEHALVQFTHSFDSTETRRLVVDFIRERLRGYAAERGFGPDEIDTVLDLYGANPLDFDARLRAVKTFRELPEAVSLASANKRIRNILKKTDEPVAANVDDRLLAEPAEQALLAAAREAANDVLPMLAARDYTAALRRLAGLRDTVDGFFDAVMVNCEDAEVRRNRLGLLAIIERLFLDIADVSCLQ